MTLYLLYSMLAAYWWKRLFNEEFLPITTIIHSYNQWVKLLSPGLTFLTEVVQHLSETYQLALKLAFTNQRGFHVTYKIPKNSNMPDLPQEFIKVSQSRGLISMTTDKLVSDWSLILCAYYIIIFYILYNFISKLHLATYL